MICVTVRIAGHIEVMDLREYPEERMQEDISITSAIKYLNIVIPAKAGIQEGTGCRIKSGMTELDYLIARLTLTLQKSRMLQFLGGKGEAVVLYRKPLTTTEMWYPRLSHRVNNMAGFRCFQDVTWSVFRLSHKEC